MIVRINFLKRSLLVILCLLLLSCDNQEDRKRDENTYRIISFLIKEIKGQSILHPIFPPAPGKTSYIYTIKDSLNKYKYFYEQYNKKNIIALKKNTSIILKSNSVFSNKCKIDKELIERPLSAKRIMIDIEKVSQSKKDSLVYYLEDKKQELSEGFNKIDFLISFSRIVYNEDFTKAFLIVNVTYEKLNSTSTLIYLEKKHHFWQIKCERVLSFS